MDLIWTITYTCVFLCVISLISRLYISYKQFKHIIKDYEISQEQLAKKLIAYDKRQQQLKPQIIETKKRYKAYLESQEEDD